MYIPEGGDIQSNIHEEENTSLHCAHPSVKKICVEIKKLFFWVAMKCDVLHFDTKYLQCHKVKANHHHLVGLLELHGVPMSKWEVISMDFIVGLPLTSQRHKAIFVIVDKLTKSAHFILVKDTYDATDVAHFFIIEVIHLHGLPKNTILDRDSWLAYRFWTSFQSYLRTQLNVSTMYHSETHG
jgi:hypothetical protein